MTDLEAEVDRAWTAYENEIEASAWALRAQAEHIRRLERELEEAIYDAEVARHKAAILAEQLRTRDEPEDRSGVRMKAAPAMRKAIP